MGLRDVRLTNRAAISLSTAGFVSMTMIRGDFGRRILLLAGGTGFGQALLVLVAPVLTRLYSPTDFGVFAVFSNLNAILGGIIALRYEFAVPVATSEERAASTVMLALLICLAMAGVTALGVAIGGEVFAAWLAMPELHQALWLLPIALLVFGLAQPFDYWSLRHNSVRSNAVSRLVLFGGQGLVQVVLGLSGWAALGLVAGYVSGYASRLLVLLSGLSRTEWQRLAAVDRADLVDVARQGWHYPIYATGSTLAQGLVNFMPAILVAALYDAATAGMFGLAQRILVMPIRLVSAAASQVFLDEAAGLDHHALRRLRNVTIANFLGLGVLVMGPVLLAGPSLFAVLFGEEWRTAGTMAQLLVVPQLARFVLMPVSQTFNVLGRMDLDLLTALLGAGLLFAAFGLGAAFGWSALPMIAAYALAMTIGQLLTLLVIWRLAQDNRGPARRPGANG